jgi:hypothetical protein
MTSKTYHGSCHCGAVKFAAEADLAMGGGKCNCSYCAKTRAWNFTLKPAQFRLAAGEAALGDYTFGSGQAHHAFCKQCGVRVFTRGHNAEIGGAFVAINLACLDDVSEAELAAMPVRYANGRDDDWFHEPAVTSHL